MIYKNLTSPINKLLCLYIPYKFVLMCIALYLLRNKITLGDYATYIQSNLQQTLSEGSKIFLVSTEFVKFVTAFLNFMDGNTYFFTNLCFNFLSIFGVIFLLRVLDSPLHIRNLPILILLFLPSFNIYSSYASKEAILVFISGYIASKIIFYYQTGNNELFNWKIIPFYYLLFLFKPLYFLFLIPTFFYCTFSRYRFKTDISLFIITLAIITIILFFWIFNEKIDAQVVGIHRHFSMAARLARENIWGEPGSFVKTLPYAMFISLFGIKYGEIFTTVDALAFSESLIIFFLLGMLFSFFLYLWIESKFSLLRIFTILLSFAILLMTQVPYGTFNPGAAIRYRTDVYLFIIAFFYLLVNNWYFGRLKKHNDEKDNCYKNMLSIKNG